MGLNFSDLYNFFFPKRQVRVLILELDNAGKSTILYKLKLNKLTVQNPTTSFNVETVEYKNLSLTIWDVSAQTKIRNLWKHYFVNNDAIIFVIDSNDAQRFEEAKEELHILLTREELKDSTLLVLANKQDLPHAMKVSDVTEKLGMSSLQERKWHVQGMSVVKGDGLNEGLDWLIQNLASK